MNIAIIYTYMQTINISLPEKLKTQADTLIKEGYYASFSDLARTALRTIMSTNPYDRMAKSAMDEYRKGKSTILESHEDIDAYLDTIVKKAKK